MIVLHKSLVTAGESLHLSADTWGITWSDHVLPMVQRLSSSASDGSSAGGAAKAAHETAHSVSISMAINTVSKTYLAHISDLMQLRDWRGLWLATLQVGTLTPTPAWCPHAVISPSAQVPHGERPPGASPCTAEPCGVYSQTALCGRCQ